MKTSFVRWIAGATLAAAGLWNGSALAAAPPPVPQTLQQQGRILDSDGAPVSSKVHFVFSVYAKAAGGKALWAEEQDLTLDDGYFSTELGSVTKIPADLFDGSALYLGVTVGNDDEMEPRQTVSSVPYALLAGSAVTALSAVNTPFTGLTGFPAPCAAGQYLKGFAADGTATCGTPALSCSTYTTDGTTASTLQACTGTGEVMTGGGCQSNAPLLASYKGSYCSPLVILNNVVGTPPPTANAIIKPICVGGFVDKWTCTTAAAATTTASAICCKIQ
ncbi:MAG: hypothetical protein ABIQ16_00740 [Polyangiaceae bacterium]